MYHGVVKYPVSATFLNDVLHALATFPGLKESDLIDSITQLVAYPENALKFARQKHRRRICN